MKGDVGMVCQKVHKQGRIKVMVNIQSLIHPYIFSQRGKGVGMGLCILTITFILSYFYWDGRLEVPGCWTVVMADQ